MIGLKGFLFSSFSVQGSAAPCSSDFRKTVSSKVNKLWFNKQSDCPHFKKRSGFFFISGCHELTERVFHSDSCR